MSLTGNLEIFPMPEVLRLLSRSKKTGCLRVDAADTHGRVYLAGGAITFANTESDDVVRQALINGGLVSDESLRNSGGSLLDAVVDGADSNAITDFVREQVVESLYRIRKPGHGEFEFAVDLQPSIQTGQQFDAEVAVAESERRAAEWDDILESIESLDIPIRMVRELADDNSVTIAAPTWKVLASLEGGTSVRELAHRAGMSEFRAARELSGLIKSELVSKVDRHAGFDSGYQAPVVEKRPVETASPFVDEARLEAPAAPVEPPSTPVEPVPAPEEPAAAPVDDFDSFFDTTPVEEPAKPEPESTWEPSPWDAPEQSPAGDVEDSSGWFDEAMGGVTSDDGDASEDPAFADQAPADTHESSDGGWWANAMDKPEEEANGQSDPDSFLESVFSQLGEEEEQTEAADDEDETGFSMGLLRRRRMGTAAKDISEG